MSRHRKVVRLGLFGLAVLPILSVAYAQGTPMRTFRSRECGVVLDVPKSWLVDDKDIYPFAFALLMPQPGQAEVSRANCAGLVTCRIWIADESLEAVRAAFEDDERRTRDIRGPQRVDFRIVESPQGRRLEVAREFLEDGRVRARDRDVSFIANRQRYEIGLGMADQKVDPKQWPKYDAAFSAMLDSVKFTPPDAGADLVDKARNRWVHRHNHVGAIDTVCPHVAIDLPEGWAPVLNPVEGDQFWATGPAHGAVWPHNYLKVSRTPGKFDLHELAKSRPDELERSLDAYQPNYHPCKVLKCELVKQGKTDALEIIYRRYSDTVYERQFHIKGSNYEVSFTIESKRAADLSPVIRKCLDGLQLIPDSDRIGGTRSEDRRAGGR
jgi:hypothetical protein